MVALAVGVEITYPTADQVTLHRFPRHKEAMVATIQVQVLALVLAVAVRHKLAKTELTLTEVAMEETEQHRLSQVQA
jgi:hypothetical protein